MSTSAPRNMPMGTPAPFTSDGPVKVTPKQTLQDKWREILMGLKENQRRVTVTTLGGAFSGDVVEVEELAVILDSWGESRRHFIGINGICAVTREL